MSWRKSLAGVCTALALAYSPVQADTVNSDDVLANIRTYAVEERGFENDLANRALIRCLYEFSDDMGRWNRYHHDRDFSSAVDTYLATRRDGGSVEDNLAAAFAYTWLERNREKRNKGRENTTTFIAGLTPFLLD